MLGNDWKDKFLKFAIQLSFKIWSYSWMILMWWSYTSTDAKNEGKWKDLKIGIYDFDSFLHKIQFQQTIEYFFVPTKKYNYILLFSWNLGSKSCLQCPNCANELVLQIW
jgi:hypothetical protein